MLVSRNVDTSNFAVSGENDMSKRDEKIKLFDVPPFGAKGAVIVYKNGSVRKFKANELTLKNVYSDMPVVSLPDGITLKYLRP